MAEIAHDESGLEPHLHGVLVPTMGALHAGHLSLIERAAKIAHQGASNRAGPLHVVVSVYVNPAQFDDASDFDRYPRSLGVDVMAASRAGADCVFAPTEDIVYPNSETIELPRLPQLATTPGLEEAHRPGHFAGVWRVVKRLFELTQPACAVFGEKDWQQLQMVRELAASMTPAVRIEAGPTVRESDGLAMSSRNSHLAGAQRRRAIALRAALQAGAAERSPVDAERVMRRVMEEAGVQVDYAVVRNAVTLAPLSDGADDDHPARALVAGRLGSIRLIDNAPWP